MSFRLRVLGLVSLVAVIAIGTTAYLAFWQTSKQVNESAAADRDTVLLINADLAGYATDHGTWEGIAQTLLDLRKRTGQRIKLSTNDGAVVADTDTLEGRTARTVTGPPILIDPRPVLNLPGLNFENPGPAEFTLDLINKYRFGVRLAACLTRNGLGAWVQPGDYGIPSYAPAGDAARDHAAEVAHCTAEASSPGVPPTAAEEVNACMDFRKVRPPLPDKRPVLPSRIAESETTPPPDESETATRTPPPTDGSERPSETPEPDPNIAVTDCLQKAFARHTADVTPAPLLVYLGAIDERGRALTPAPVIAAAILVALLAVAGSALLSRRVLRPIGALTAASQRLGEGDLRGRVPVKGRDEVAGLARSFNRMADSLQRGEERQRRLVADVAHELRTPLANLRGYLEALRDGVIPADQALFASLHDEAVLQQRIVDDLQDLALAEAGALAYHRTDVDLAELVETCRTAHQAAADAATVTLGVHARGPLLMHADPDRLRQVIGNLVVNALRATPAGGSVTLRVSMPAGGQVTIEVRDTGAGIAPEDLPHVFDRFWRADPARGRTTGGSGLGLAIARQIVTDHGGSITVNSRLGEGTVVTIALPATG